MAWNITQPGQNKQTLLAEVKGLPAIAMLPHYVLCLPGLVFIQKTLVTAAQSFFLLVLCTNRD